MPQEHTFTRFTAPMCLICAHSSSGSSSSSLSSSLASSSDSLEGFICDKLDIFIMRREFLLAFSAWLPATQYAVAGYAVRASPRLSGMTSKLRQGNTKKSGKKWIWKLKKLQTRVGSWIKKSANTLNRSINQSINRAVEQVIHQPFNQSIDPSCATWTKKFHLLQSINQSRQ